MFEAETVVVAGVSGNQPDSFSKRSVALI